MGQEVVILADQTLEIVALGKSLRMVGWRRGRWSIWTTIRSDLPMPGMGRSSEVTAQHR